MGGKCELCGNCTALRNISEKQNSLLKEYITTNIMPIKDVITGVFHRGN